MTVEAFSALFRAKMTIAAEHSDHSRIELGIQAALKGKQLKKHHLASAMNANLKYSILLFCS